MARVERDKPTFHKLCMYNEKNSSYVSCILSKMAYFKEVSVFILARESNKMVATTSFTCQPITDSIELHIELV